MYAAGLAFAGSATSVGEGHGEYGGAGAVERMLTRGRRRVVPLGCTGGAGKICLSVENVCVRTRPQILPGMMCGCLQIAVAMKC